MAKAALRKTLCFEILTAISAISGSCLAIRSVFGEGDGDSAQMSGFPLGTSGATSYDNYLTHYYDNLTENFGMNYQSSCGYVALAMLLSFYDACFDGDLVPNGYDVKSYGTDGDLVGRKNSPGVEHDDFDNMGFGSIYTSYPGWNLYLTFAQLIKGHSLHAKLITLGSTLGYVNSASSNPFSTTLSQRKNVLSNYLERVAALANSDYSFVYYQGSNTYPDGEDIQMRSAIRNLIDSGHPVLVGIGNGNGSKHAVIAYDYDRDSLAKTLYFHPGLSYEGYTTHMSLADMSYSYVNSYMAIDFNYEGTPDTNYIIHQGNTNFQYAYDSAQLNWEGNL